MKEQPHYTDLLTTEFFTKFYLEKRMSFPEIRAMLLEENKNIAVGTLYKYCKSLGFITRDRSEARREWDENPLNYDISYMSGPVIEAVDGFLLGDGGINYDKRSVTSVARFICGVQYEEFSRYLISFFEKYIPHTSATKSKKSPNGTTWQSITKSHSDIYNQYLRWYPEINGRKIKQPPDDIRITPTSVMMWYLGDGSVITPNNTIMLRLSTDGFLPERVEFLAQKLKYVGIDCHRNNDNRIMVDAKGIPSFFNFIGRESPIRCYDYKFDIPEFRFESKRMSEVAEDLKVDYDRLAYLVKIGRIPCYRLSDKGRPRFLSDHINLARELVKNRELY